MIAFWIAVVVGGIVGVIYVTLGVQAFFRVRRDVLALAESGAAAEIDTAGPSRRTTGPSPGRRSPPW